MATDNSQNTIQKKKKKNVLVGTVISHDMNKTVTVSVTRYTKYSKYGKYMKLQKRYKAHDEDNAFSRGDIVTIRESQPISKDKHFVVIR